MFQFLLASWIVNGNYPISTDVRRKNKHQKNVKKESNQKIKKKKQNEKSKKTKKNDSWTQRWTGS